MPPAKAPTRIASGTFAKAPAGKQDHARDEPGHQGQRHRAHPEECLSVEIEAAADCDTQPAPALVGEKTGEQQRQITARPVLHETHRADAPQR